MNERDLQMLSVLQRWNKQFGEAPLPELPSSNDQPLMGNMLQRPEAYGQYDRSKQNAIASEVLFGRLGSGLPLGDGELSMGVSGGGHRVKGSTPYGPISNTGLDRIGFDAAYSQGDNTYGMNYERNPNLPAVRDMLNFFYTRRF